MPHLTTVSVAKHLSLRDLQAVVQQQEEILGPLHSDQSAGLGSDENQTLLTFDMAQKSPTRRAILRPVVGGQAAPLEGHEPICIVRCFVANRVTRLAAYRPHETSPQEKGDAIFALA